MRNINEDQAHQHQHHQFISSVIPTALRFGDSGTRTGKGVTIAFLDSGFTLHPDLYNPENRILAYEDITGEGELLSDPEHPESWQWHGTMTSVVAAGNGFLSDGVYKGLAPEATLVLVKVSNRGRILEDDIVRGIEWVTANREKYGIRILNISLGSDIDESYHASRIDQAAEEATRAGIVVVVAAGNSGCTDANAIRPPGNSPSVITVGGYDDNNSLASDNVGLYCSNFGQTVDGFHKPEILAPAIWVAAPILRGTHQYRYSEFLSELTVTPGYLLEQRLKESTGLANPPQEVISGGPKANSTWVQSELESNKFIGTHYMHVDGTSFAAPITSSIIARMLEANPGLDPATLKNILISTATPIAGQAAIRQGFGRVNLVGSEAAAVQEVHDHSHIDGSMKEGSTTRLSYHDDLAQKVDCYTSLDGWQLPIPMQKDKEGIWRLILTVEETVTLRYKFLIDDERWIADPENPDREEDGFGGWNSILKASWRQGTKF